MMSGYLLLDDYLSWSLDENLKSIWICWWKYR